MTEEECKRMAKILEKAINSLKQERNEHLQHLIAEHALKLEKESQNNAAAAEQQHQQEQLQHHEHQQINDQHQALISQQQRKGFQFNYII